MEQSVVNWNNLQLGSEATDEKGAYLNE